MIYLVIIYKLLCLNIFLELLLTQGMLHDPVAFQLCIDVFVKRYAKLDVTCIAGIDARGFVLGPPIALALKKPFIMVRKQGKLPNSISGNPYFKEYDDGFTVAGDILCVSRTALTPQDRVLVIDDLVATGVIIHIYNYIIIIEIIPYIFT